MKLSSFGRAGLWDTTTGDATDLAYASSAPLLPHAAPEVSKRDSVPLEAVPEPGSGTGRVHEMGDLDTVLGERTYVHGRREHRTPTALYLNPSQCANKKVRNVGGRTVAVDLMSGPR